MGQLATHEAEYLNGTPDLTTHSINRLRRCLRLAVILSVFACLVGLGIVIGLEIRRSNAFDTLNNGESLLIKSNRFSSVSAEALPKCLKNVFLDVYSIRGEASEVNTEAIRRLGQLSCLCELELTGIRDFQVVKDLLPQLAKLHELNLFGDGQFIHSQVFEIPADFNVDESNSIFHGLTRCKNFKKLRLQSVPLSAADMKTIRGLTTLEVLVLDRCDFDYSDLNLLAEHPSLRLVWLKDPRFNDRSLSIIATFPKLEGLKVLDSSVTSQGLRALAAHLKLRNLETEGIQITRDALQALKSCSELKEMEIDGRQLDDTDYSLLTQFPKLTSLIIRNSRISDRGLEYIGKLTNLETLHVYSQEYTDRGTEQLRSLKNLQCLILGDSLKLTDSTSETVARLPKLLYLGITAAKAGNPQTWPRFHQLMDSGKFFTLECSFYEFPR
ncbi:MAG: F-box/LRR-repeat protein 14 isoform [Planctomycetaceae bacterium]|nr:F-box/LRR-repeat protein 14 isoform [Planctomycetaceae bacterium]